MAAMARVSSGIATFKPKTKSYFKAFNSLVRTEALIDVCEKTEDQHLHQQYLPPDRQRQTPQRNVSRSHSEGYKPNEKDRHMANEGEELECKSAGSKSLFDWFFRRRENTSQSNNEQLKNSKYATVVRGQSVNQGLVMTVRENAIYPDAEEHPISQAPPNPLEALGGLNKKNEIEDCGASAYSYARGRVSFDRASSFQWCDYTPSQFETSFVKNPSHRNTLSVELRPKLQRIRTLPCTSIYQRRQQRKLATHTSQVFQQKMARQELKLELHL